jgi:glycosyltransferase involved in cell wall biosynthesis
MSMSHRFHVVALPHTQTTKTHNGCAYTMKVWNFCKMMAARGHTVYHYGCESSNPPCTEHVDVISLEEQQLLCGENDWRKHMYNVVWDERQPYWMLTNSRAIVEIKKRAKPDDFVCLIGGTCQKPIADGLSGLPLRVVEFGIGYRGVFAPFRVFESYSHASCLYGANDPDGRFYDAVIPNYYDVAEFPFQPVKQDYYLYLGRCIKRKGLQIAVETCKTIGARLVVAGQGVESYVPASGDQPASMVCTDSTYVGDIEFVGFADIPTRANLMGAAKAVFVPTLYLGPFEGVNVEAQLCGTPVITTDWGAFTDTVEHGKTGFRCRTHEQFCWAAQHVQDLDPQYIRDRAVTNWSLEKVGSMYQEYFDQLKNLSKRGYYEENAARTQLDWLVRR